MLSLLLLFGCFEGEAEQEVTASPEQEEDTFDLVAEFSMHLQGNFSSQQQANINPNYYPVSLKACPIDVPDLGDVALYVEQALIGSAPYRQRIYILSSDETAETVRSTVYSIPNEQSFVGYCDAEEEWTISAADTELRDGCHVILEWDGSGFHGSSEDQSCESTMSGASYATSIVTTTPDLIKSWDRGWFANGEQAWGAVDGPYLFRRIIQE